MFLVVIEAKKKRFRIFFKENKLALYTHKYQRTQLFLLPTN
jgi:hypothetical protein